MIALMKILFIGDIVGKPGVRLVQQVVPALRTAGRVDVVIANAENAANNGSGCTPADFRRLRDAGVDLVTLGDHVYKKAEIIGTLEQDDRICKPANLPPAAPGKEFALATSDGTTVATFSLLGRTFMRPADDPYVAADRVLARLAGVARIVILDMHAEATADKYLMAHYLNGRVAAVIGTHTHVPTADEQILPGGTAFICDVGMTGPYASILGRRVDRVLSVSVTAVPAPFEVATDDVRLGGAIIDVDPTTGRARQIERVMFTAADLPATTPQSA